MADQYWADNIQAFMPDGHLISEEQIAKMSVGSIHHTGIVDITSRHIPCIVIQGRYDLICPVRWPDHSGSR